MKETRRKKITLLGWVTAAIFLMIFIVGLIFVWPHFMDFFAKPGIAPWLSGIIGFILWYFIVAGIMLVVMKLGEGKLFREEQ